MIQNMTKEMTDELNKKLQEEGCNFYFTFSEFNSTLGVIHPKFINTKFLDLNVCSINTEGFRFIKKFFAEKRIEVLHSTRSGGIMVAQHDGKVY